jgi:L-threonylcarbamoyladenylate synthase
VIISQTNESFPRISEIIARGGLIAFRTDTFYGLGSDPFNRNAVQRIKQLKGRGENKPILVVISEREAATRFISEPTPAFDLLAEKFWPGPLTLIGQSVSDVPEEVTAGTKTIGLRLPGDDRVRALVRACGGALTATSANPSHQEPATTAQKVFSYFGKAIDLIVDDGSAKTDQPSTVVDVCDVEPRVIREGMIAWSAIQTELSKIKIKHI